MSTIFYASGILYNLKTQQILLYQASSSPFWHLLGGENKDKETAEETFIRVIYSKLQLTLNKKYIQPVYDYFHEGHEVKNYVFYAEIDEPEIFSPSISPNGIFSWFNFKQTLKLPFTSQTKQDVVVIQRVVNAQARGNDEKTQAVLKMN